MVATKRVLRVGTRALTPAQVSATLDELRADGFREVRPGLEEWDEVEAAAEEDCPGCGDEGMDLRAFRGAHGYRAWPTCRRCGAWSGEL